MSLLVHNIVAAAIFSVSFRGVDFFLPVYVFSFFLFCYLLRPCCLCYLSVTLTLSFVTLSVILISLHVYREVTLVHL